MNDFFELIRRRYSVRAYKDAPVDEEALNSVLEAATSAPSAGNLQPYEIVLVRDPERRKKLAEAAHEQWFVAEAPVVLVFFADPERSRWRYTHRGAELYALQDATIACAYAQLAATAIGLGTCWIGAFNDEEVRHIVSAPATWRPMSMLTIGHAAEPQKASERRAIHDIVHHEKARR